MTKSLFSPGKLDYSKSTRKRTQESRAMAAATEESLDETGNNNTKDRSKMGGIRWSIAHIVPCDRQPQACVQP